MRKYIRLQCIPHGQKILHSPEENKLSVEHRVNVLEEVCARKSTVPGPMYMTDQIITQAR